MKKYLLFILDKDGGINQDEDLFDLLDTIEDVKDRIDYYTDPEMNMFKEEEFGILEVDCSNIKKAKEVIHA